MQKIKTGFILALVSIALITISCSRRTDMNALIVTGQNNHNWQKSSRYLQDIIEKSGLFTAEITQSPAQGEDMSGFIVDFSPYNVVVLDYNGDEWPEETKNNFVRYVKNGGGVVVYHASDNAFSDWPEYNEMIGFGGWGGRDENSGPYVYIEDGEVVRDDSPGGGGTHGAQREFLVEAFQPNHPIIKGLPQKWMHAKDELYANMRGPAKNMEILAFAHSLKTEKNEPMLMTITYGEGRIFHTMLGHAGGGNFFPAMECAGFVTTTQRGTEWAATGEVTLEIPQNFPTENETLRWAFFEDIHGDITPFVNRMKDYEIGQSNESFTILKTLMQENINNPEKMNKYHNVIIDLLESSKTSDECKKILLKEFSWMANASYKKVYEDLLEKPALTDEARYALDQMN
jgi:type 1 glutamine amidotransferase